jgi:hypothetical protein
MAIKYQHKFGGNVQITVRIGQKIQKYTHIHVYEQLLFDKGTVSLTHIL